MSSHESRERRKTARRPKQERRKEERREKGGGGKEDRREETEGRARGGQEGERRGRQKHPVTHTELLTETAPSHSSPRNWRCPQLADARCPTGRAVGKARRKKGAPLSANSPEQPRQEDRDNRTEAGPEKREREE